MKMTKSSLKVVGIAAAIAAIFAAGYAYRGASHIQPVTQELAASFGLEKSTGALVSEVRKDKN